MINNNCKIRYPYDVNIIIYCFINNFQYVHTSWKRTESRKTVNILNCL